MADQAERRELDSLREQWEGSWEGALSAWSRFTKLTPPRWCLSKTAAEKEKLTDSFAMIRLQDHAVVINLLDVHERKIDGFALEVLAHEIGHHVYAPADLRDNALLLARIKAGLPTREHMAGMIANLYTDLLINDRLQRSAELDMAGLYKKLKIKTDDKLWRLYMGIYENLWGLPAGTLVDGEPGESIRVDAQLGARVVRAYAKDWINGAGRFAALCLTYLLEDPKYEQKAVLFPWMDAMRAGEGDQLPDGLSEIPIEELEGAIHPSEDDQLTGFDLDQAEKNASDAEHPGQSAGRETVGGHKNRYRDPRGYVELMKSLGVKIDEKAMLIKYYRERALPYIVKFPAREYPRSSDPLPEGVEDWDVGSPIQNIDWLESLGRSPVVIPGATTVERVYGTTEGDTPDRVPLDLYLGVDCSGSMINPAFNLSHPVLAGAVIVLSALRAGASVMVCLSGEPGEHSETEGFVRNEKQAMTILTGYLGTGYAYGILRLKNTFLKGDPPRRPTHIMIVTDSDIFHMLKEVKNGWEIARDALDAAGGGGTMVLNMSPGYGYQKELERLRGDGWNIHFVTAWEDMLEFARAFARQNYERRGHVK